ncbi:hypothetical protein Tco_0545210 [Tanacetum coccineum]
MVINIFAVIFWQRTFKLSVGEDHKQRPAGALANLVADEKCCMEVAAFDRYLCFSNACLQLQAHGSPTIEAIAEAGGIKTLVDMIFKWSNDGDGVLKRPAGVHVNLFADEKCSMEVAAFDRYLCFSNACLQLQAHGSPTTVAATESSKISSPKTAGCVHTLARIVATDDNVIEDQPRSAILGVSLLHTDNKEVEVVLSDNGSSQKVTPDADSTADLALDDPLPVVEKGKVSDGVEHVVHELSGHCDRPIENLNAEHK